MSEQKNDQEGEVAPEHKASEPTALPEPPDMEVASAMRQMSRRSFLWGAVAVAGALAGRQWLITRRQEAGVIWPLRRTLEINEGLARDYFSPSRLAPEFNRAMAREPRVNGTEGFAEDFDPSTWKLRVFGLADTTSTSVMKDATDTKDDESTSTSEPEAEGAVLFTMAQIKALPRVEMVTELKCIEGWSTVVHWAGARFADFLAKYPPVRTNDSLPEYISLETPDKGYYVGLDMASAQHPQTLLCYEMNGVPLTPEHGAPLRLVIPVKYGIKNIKRIGTIRYQTTRPADFWAEQGYDWYAGH